MESIGNKLSGFAGLDGQIGLNPLSSARIGGNGATEETQLDSTLGSFGTMLKTELNKINQLQTEANQNIQTYATGGNIELHNVITSVDKADMALQLAVQVRNRMVSAYQEVFRMNV